MAGRSKSSISNSMNVTRRNDLIVFLATGCFTGFLPVMPGTWGTFAAVPLVMLVLRGSTLLQPIVAVLFVAFAIWIAARAQILFQDRDPRSIVIDEMAGFLVSLLWLPLRPLTVCLGFVLFRVFDIVKPPPISIAEKRLHGGWAIVIDDVLAGVLANATLRVLLIVAGLL
jgi:phosphatidylglycerophosphatase A